MFINYLFFDYNVIKKGGENSSLECREKYVAALLISQNLKTKQSEKEQQI